MDLVLLVGIALAAVLAAGELVRRAVLGDRMTRSFEALKVRTRQSALLDAVMMPRAPVPRKVSIQAARDDQGPMASSEESMAAVRWARMRHVHFHARRAS